MSLGFKILKISTDKYEATIGNVDIENSECNISSSVDVKISNKSKLVYVKTGFAFEQNKDKFLEIETSNTYAISNQLWNTFENEKEIIIPSNFISTLLSISINTTRGVLHTKTENSELNQYLLPLIDVFGFNLEDGVFDKSEV